MVRTSDYRKKNNLLIRKPDDMMIREMSVVRFIIVIGLTNEGLKAFIFCSIHNATKKSSLTMHQQL